MGWNKNQHKNQNQKPANEKQVGKILDQAKENLEKAPEQSIASHNFDKAAGSDKTVETTVHKNVIVKVEEKKQHPKFDKFKKGEK
jgi:hypothetical protein